VSARLVELAIFSFLLPVGVWGLLRALRRDRTWIAGAAIFTGLCVLSIVLTLQGHTLMGGGGYGVDHRRQDEDTTAGDVVLAAACVVVGVLAIWGVRTAARRRHDG
jgi:hypothetical protein